MLLDIKGAHFGFSHEEPILAGFDLGIDRGEFVALLGPSGCGKSTLLNIAAGLLKPLSGTVTFDGRHLTGINRDVGYMTQGDTLLPWLTVEKNVMLPLELRGVPAEQRRRKLASALQLVNLTQAAKKFPSELSGGMKRRALLARSLIYDPPMILMDEPFAALDAQLRETMHAELLATVRRVGSSVMFVTHDISESIFLADRILVLGKRPLVVVEEIRLPFGKSRNLDQVRVSKEFAELEGRIRNIMQTPKEPVTDEKAHL